MTLYAKVIGKVQGVYFRAFTQKIARELDLRGTVRNLSDGSVEVVAVGEEEKINKLIKELKKGSPGSKVIDIEIKKDKHDLDFEDFKIVY
ncbi:Acylphosphatase [Thermodesulfobium narugense DSM 14796]|uniref:acylphosphatase n=1 Tax=Thermodesulfobium narugense DSM 14796 TaxID=747365 RepID=M1E8W6_9BACT|nr:acylphosphatase [Thermodesulfobium narugense]AEE15413.1 Acylphosphatase [Thermodesulfobium narugense DSM 14796]